MSRNSKAKSAAKSVKPVKPVAQESQTDIDAPLLDVAEMKPPAAADVAPLVAKEVPEKAPLAPVVGKAPPPPIPEPPKAVEAPAAHKPDDLEGLAAREAAVDVPETLVEELGLPGEVRAFMELFATVETMGDATFTRSFDLALEGFVTNMRAEHEAAKMRRDGYPVAQQYKVLATTKVPLKGQIVEVYKDQILNSNTYGADNIRVLQRSGVKLAQLAE